MLFCRFSACFLPFPLRARLFAQTAAHSSLMKPVPCRDSGCCMTVAIESSREFIYRISCLSSFYGRNLRAASRQVKRFALRAEFESPSRHGIGPAFDVDSLELAGHSARCADLHSFDSAIRIVIVVSIYFKVQNEFQAACRCFSFRTAAATAQTAPVRPKITGISHLAVYTSDPAATDRYYREIVGAAKLPDPENPKGVRYAFNATQFVEVLPLPPGSGINRLDHSAYNTSRRRRTAQIFGRQKPGRLPPRWKRAPTAASWFTVLDPGGQQGRVCPAAQPAR